MEIETHELQVPERLPYMSIGQTTLFPHAMLPLYLFEPRYRDMIRDVLQSHRLFAVVGGSSESPASESSDASTPLIGGLGIVRACKQGEDGTYNLVLQGLSRIALHREESDSTYPIARIEKLDSVPGASPDDLIALRDKLVDTIESEALSVFEIPDEVLNYISSVEDPEIVLDLAIYTLCPPGSVKQSLLETLNVRERYETFLGILGNQIDGIDS